MDQALAAANACGLALTLHSLPHRDSSRRLLHEHEMYTIPTVIAHGNPSLYAWRSSS